MNRVIESDIGKGMFGEHALLGKMCSPSPVD